MNKFFMLYPKKNKTIKIFVLLILFISSAATNASPLSINDRSPELKNQIESQFQEAKIEGYRFYEGRDYGMKHFVFSYDLAKAVIKSAPKSQKEFYFVDIGAGYGGYLDGLAKELNELSGLDDEIHIHLIGFTAQNNTSYDKVRVGRCTKYLYGNFNAENFTENLRKFGLDIANKIDLAVSEYTFIHLVDPLGTLVEVYNNLRPGSGLFFSQYFLAQTNIGQKGEIASTLIREILPLTNAQFVETTVGPGLSYFLLRRFNDEKMRMPFAYGKLIEAANYSSGKWLRAGYILEKDQEIKELRTYYSPKIFYDVTLYGSPNSESLYRWLVSYTDLSVKTSIWHSIFADDDASKQHIPPKTIFDTVKNEQLVEFEKMLEKHPELANAKDYSGEALLFHAYKVKWKYSDNPYIKTLMKFNPDILIFDNNGNTLLTNTIGNNDEEGVVQIFSQKVPLLEFKTKGGKTPLMRAIEELKYKSEESYKIVKILLNAGAKVDSKDEAGKTPLHYASILVNNPFSKEVIEILVAAGAEVNSQDENKKTPLHDAAASVNRYYKDNGLIKLLIDKNADPCAKDDQNRIPRDSLGKTEDMQLRDNLLRLLTCEEKY